MLQREMGSKIAPRSAPWLQPVQAKGAEGIFILAVERLAIEPSPSITKRDRTNDRFGFVEIGIGRRRNTEPLLKIDRHRNREFARHLQSAIAFETGWWNVRLGARSVPYVGVGHMALELLAVVDGNRDRLRNRRSCGKLSYKSEQNAHA